MHIKGGLNLSRNIIGAVRKIRGILTLLFFVISGYAVAQGADNTEMPKLHPEDFIASGLNPNAPPELEHLGKIVGEWSIYGVTKNDDGEFVKSEQPAADWNFYYTLDGHAIHDVWIAPPRTVEMKDPSKRQIGVNMRIYWPQKEKWEMVWVSPGWGYIMSFSATSDDEKVVMLTDEPTPQGDLRRVTFYNMTDNNFDWKSERSQDGGETWQEFFWLHGVRKN